jgi:hypothetical protein
MSALASAAAAREAQVNLLARNRAEVPVRSDPVSATMENGVSWVISRTVSPPPTPASGCWVRTVSSAMAWSSSPPPGRPPTAHGTITTVAAMAVNRIVGVGRRGDTSRMLRMSQQLPALRHGLVIAM